MKISTVIGGGIVFVAGLGTGMCLMCKAAVKIDEKIYKGKLREKFIDATSDRVTEYMHKRFEPKRFEPKRFEYSRYNTKYSYRSPKDVIFSTRTDAEETLTKLNELIEEYGQVSVADFYDLVGANSSYTDSKYGWKNGISDDSIFVTKDGWFIDFPGVCNL